MNSEKNCSELMGKMVMREVGSEKISQNNDYEEELMANTLCKRVKDDYLKENLKEYIKMVKEPKYICKKCGRVAEKEEMLCKPKKME